MPCANAVALLRARRKRWPIKIEQKRCFLRLIKKTVGWHAMSSKNERVELEMKIMKARQLAWGADDTTRERLEALIVELEQKLREIDE
jgi:hypothetical protein